MYAAALTSKNHAKIFLMKRWVLLFLLLVALFAFYERAHLYVRDFRASVTRNGVKEDGAQVFFNLTDDVLLENDNNPMYITLLQHDKPVGEPAQLNCIHFFICLVAKDGAIVPGSENGARIQSMTATGVKFRDDEKRDTIVTFR
jgi:hypothetical protein